MTVSTLRKIKPLSKQWRKLAYDLALATTPNIFACGKCNHPVVKGYCCEFCGDSDPDRNAKGQNVSIDFYW